MDSPINILVVDDNEDLADNLKDILNELGYGASTAFNGGDAVALWKQTPFDVALLDYKLPDMDGMELRGRLSEIRDAVYILITGVAREAWVDDALRQGRIAAFEGKPLNIDRLLKRIEEVADRRGKASSADTR